MNIKQLSGLAAFALLATIPSPGHSGTPAPSGEYEAPGYSFHSSPFRLSVNLREGYDDNVKTTKTDKIASWFTAVFADLTADLSNPRTQFSIGIGGGGTYYYDVPGTNWDWNGRFKLSLIHRINPRLTLTARSLVTYEVQPDFSEQVGVERSNGQYLYTNSGFGLTYQWTQKFQTVTSYSFVSVNYEDSFDARVNDRIENYIDQQFRFLLTPVTTVVGEYRIGFVNYDQNTLNNSTTNFLLAGFDHVFSPKLNIAIRAGAEIRNSDALGTQTSPYGEGTLTYIYGLYSSVDLNTRYGYEQSNLSLSNEVKTFRLGLRINHGFTPKFSLFGSTYYINNDYGGFVSYTENIVSATGGLRYSISRNWSVETAYTFTELWSSQAFREYARNRAYLGGTFSF